jgi:PKD repeat protein
VPVIAFTSTSNICPGTCINFLNLSFNAAAYYWSFPGGTPDTSTSVNPNNICYSAPGMYDVTLIATNVNGTDTLTLPNYITVFPQPPAQSISQNDDTLFAIAGSASYQWYFNGNSINGATGYLYVAQTSGDYNVVATDTNGCEVEAVINNVLAHAPLVFGYLPLAIYPNPVTSTIDIRGLENNSAEDIKIYNVIGEKVFSAVECKLPIANCQLFPGLYYIEIISGKKIYRTKFVKQ